MEDYNINRILEHFKAISTIPHGSGNESAVANMISELATSRGYHSIRDSENNVFIKISATAGMENYPSVLIQSHIDMVCEKDPDVEHDFLIDPITPIFDGDTIRAAGTTLGADDGIGVAMMLELIATDEVKHGPLELLFTTGEEVGLSGMKNFDKSRIQSRYMINLDSEEDRSAVISCAGGMRSDILFAFGQDAAIGSTVKIQIGGLAGGHSGSDIHLGRSGAVRLMAQILSEITTPYSIISIDGGGKDNAIPRSCAAEILTEDAAAFIKSFGEEDKKIRKSLSTDDSKFFTNVNCVNRNISALSISYEQSVRLVDLIMSLPNGVLSYSSINTALPETSANIASVHTDDKSIRIVVSSRSSLENSLDRLEKCISDVAFYYGATVRHRDRYPGWEYTKNSPLQAKYLSAYENEFGEKASLSCIHAGLECGLAKAAIPNMDIISIGPNMMNVHTPSEWVSISSVKKIWHLLCAMLSEIK